MHHQHTEDWSLKSDVNAHKATGRFSTCLPSNVAISDIGNHLSGWLMKMIIV